MGKVEGTTCKPPAASYRSLQALSLGHMVRMGLVSTPKHLQCLSRLKWVCSHDFRALHHYAILDLLTSMQDLIFTNFVFGNSC